LHTLSRHRRPRGLGYPRCAGFHRPALAGVATRPTNREHPDGRSRCRHADIPRHAQPGRGLGRGPVPWYRVAKSRAPRWDRQPQRVQAPAEHRAHHHCPRSAARSRRKARALLPSDRGSPIDPSVVVSNAPRVRVRVDTAARRDQYNRSNRQISQNFPIPSDRYTSKSVQLFATSARIESSQYGQVSCWVQRGRRSRTQARGDWFQRALAEGSIRCAGSTRCPIISGK
jgi:hypothetical protein